MSTRSMRVPGGGVSGSVPPSPFAVPLQGAPGVPAAGGAAGGGAGAAPTLLPAPHPAPRRAHPLPGPGGCRGVGTRSSPTPPKPFGGPLPTLPSPQPPAGTALAILEEVSSGESRQDVATKLVKIFLAQGLAVPFLDYLIARELARTSKCWGAGCPLPKTPLWEAERGHQGGHGNVLLPPSGPQHPVPLQLAGLQVRGDVHEGEQGRGTWGHMARRQGQLGDKEGGSCPTRWWGCPTCTRS